MYDLANNMKAVAAIIPIVASGAGDTNGETIDRKGYESVTFVLMLGAEGDTLSGALKYDYVMQEAEISDFSDATLVNADDIIAPAQSANVIANPTGGIVVTVDAPAEAPTVAVIGYKGGKRYVRLNTDKTGTHTNGTPTAAVALLGKPHLAPVT